MAPSLFGIVGTRYPLPRPASPTAMHQITAISSSALRGTRKIWVEQEEASTRCCIFLDAELYIERVRAPEIVHEHALPVTCVYLSYGEAVDRHTDFACNEGFATFIAEDLTLWIDNFTGRRNEFVLCGLSLSGLAAVHAANRFPKVFSRILCQSPSAWWNDEWLAKQIEARDLCQLKCWLSVGDLERDENVTHAPTGMVQGTSQYASCERLAQAIALARATVHENRYAGGHDPACWAAELPSALQWLFSP